MKHLIFFSMVSTTRRISQKNWRNDTVGTKQVLQKFYLSARKRDGTFYNKKSLTRVAREILKFHTICRYIVRSKIFFWFTSYSLCVVYTKTIIHLSVGESDGNLPRRYSPPLRLIIVKQTLQFIPRSLAVMFIQAEF